MVHDVIWLMAIMVNRRVEKAKSTRGIFNISQKNPSSFG